MLLCSGDIVILMCSCVTLWSHENWIARLLETMDHIAKTLKLRANLTHNKQSNFTVFFYSGSYKSCGVYGGNRSAQNHSCSHDKSIIDKSIFLFFITKKLRK